MTDHREFVLARMAPVNITVASTHRPLTRTKICARHIEQWFAECGSSCLVANQRREDVTFLQKQTAGHTDRFLPFADINPACDQAAAIETDELFFKRRSEEHTSELQSPDHLVCRLLLEKKKNEIASPT